MAKKISLQLEIGGVKQSISSIDELENAIKQANDELKGLEIGSAAFNKLSGQIKNAKNTAEDLQESLKGQDLEKRVGAYAKVGSAIVGSFAAAQSAISLFGSESEDVARAAAKAQAVLTIALTAREVAEGAVAVKTVAANIATYASAAAATAANGATRALYATLAANPYGALLLAIGAVIGALAIFSSDSEKQVDVLKEVNAAVSEEAVNLNRQLILLQSLNTTNALRKKTIEDLNKEYPGFNAFLDEENRLTQDGIRFGELRVKQLIEEQKVKLLVAKIAEQSVKLLEIEQENIIDNITIWDELWAAIRGVGRIVPPSALTLALEDQRERSNQARQQLEQLQKSLNIVQTEYGKTVEEIGPYTQALDKQAKLEEKLKKNQNDAAATQKKLQEAYKSGLNAAINLSEAINKLNESLKQYETTIQDLNDIELDAPIIEQLKAIKQARVDAARELEGGIQDVQKALDKVTKVPEDPLIAYFVKLRLGLEQEFNKIGTEEFKGFEQVYKKFVEELAAQGQTLTADQSKILQKLVLGYKSLNSFIQETAGFKDYIKSLTGVNVEWDNFVKGVDKTFDAGAAFQQILADILAANNKFALEFKGGTEIAAEALKANIVPPIIDFEFDVAKVQANARKYINELEKALFKPVGERLLQQQIDIQSGLLKAATSEEQKKNIQGVIDGLGLQLKALKENRQVSAETASQINKEVSTIVSNFVKLAETLTTAEQKILAVNQEVNRLTADLQNKPQELSRAIGGIVASNIDVITKTIFGATTEEEKFIDKVTEKYKNSETERLNFKKLLIQQGVDVEKASYDDLLKAYIAYKQKESNVTKTSEQKKKDEFKKSLDDIGKGIQIFQSYLSETASLVNLRIQTDIESLKIAEQKALGQVVGDTESAAKKRLEIQTEYEARRKELEKKARIASLQFTLAQAVANAAQGITRTIAELGFPLAAPFIALQVGLTAAEIAIISDQISNAQALRRGGLVKAQGGMLLSGPTHEQGGIPLAQMGVIAEGQEAIINRNSLVNYRDLLSTINQSGGGRPLVVNNFDDSRIVEAIASQRQKPLRAYVLQSEITNEQALSKRLDDLSKI